MDTNSNENNSTHNLGRPSKSIAGEPADNDSDDGHDGFESSKEQCGSKRLNPAEAKRDRDRERVKAERYDKRKDPRENRRLRFLSAPEKPAPSRKRSLLRSGVRQKLGGLRHPSEDDHRPRRSDALIANVWM